MSLLTLLVDFPNYSARKVRRLAKQLALLDELQGAKELGSETGQLKGIAADLMEYNLLEARTEAQLNDDIAVPTPSQVGSDVWDNKWWRMPTTRPEGYSDEAWGEICEMRADWARIAKAMGFDTYRDVNDIVERAKLANPNVARPPTENVVVTPVKEAMRAIDELVELGKIVDDDGSEHKRVGMRAKGIVSGSAFTTTREVPR